MLRRSLRAETLNAIVNDGSVRPWVQGPEGVLDLAPLVRDHRNILLLDGLEGAVFFHFQEDGLYEVHTQFLPKARGLRAIRSTREAVRQMFTQSPAVMLYTKADLGNGPATKLTALCHGREVFRRGTLVFYELTWEQWALHSKECAEEGHRFHGLLHAAVPEWHHAEDPVHDAVLGGALLTARAGNPLKAVALYNRWARFAGYDIATLESISPMIFSIHPARLCLTEDSFEVL